MDIQADNHFQNEDNQSGPGDQYAYVERYEIKELLVGIVLSDIFYFVK